MDDGRVLDFTSLAAPGVTGLKPYEPGKPLEALEREYGVSEAIKLASNENPLGASPAALEAVRQCLPSISYYPDGGGHALRVAVAERHGVDASRVTLGNGSNDVLELVARAFLGPGTEAVFARHAFAVYAIVTQAAGAVGRVAPARPPEDPMPYGHDLEAMAALIGPATRVVFIANPNNPTGTWVDATALAGFLEALPSRVIVVVDEAYFEYVDEPDYPDVTAWLDHYPNLVVTRTFSKIHGLAGLRAGYALSHHGVADLLNRVRQPFNMNAAAQAAAVAALHDSGHVQRSAETNREGMVQLVEGLNTRGVAFIPSVANFVTIDVGRPADAVYEALLRQGVIVRPMGAYELPRHLRVSIGTAEHNARFLEALDRVL